MPAVSVPVVGQLGHRASCGSVIAAGSCVEFDRVELLTAQCCHVTTVTGKPPERVREVRAVMAS